MNAMKKLVALVGCLGLLLAVGVGTSQAAGNATATGKVVAPITITQTTPLQFGTFAATGTAGTIVIGSNDSITVTGPKAISASTHSAAAFDITGEGTLAFTITLPADGAVSLMKDGTSSGNDIPLTAFTASLPKDGTATLSSGAATLKVGATATVPASQMAGDYSASFDVIVNYF